MSGAAYIRTVMATGLTASARIAEPTLGALIAPPFGSDTRMTARWVGRFRAKFLNPG